MIAPLPRQGGGGRGQLAGLGDQYKRHGVVDVRHCLNEHRHQEGVLSG